MAAVREPKTLLEAVVYFSDKRVAFEFMKAIRWAKGQPVCPRCGDTESSFLSTRMLWKCKGCQKQFSLKVGTIFEDSPIGLDKWLPAMWMLANCKNGISSYELARALGVTQKTAWFMLSRLRLALQDGVTGGKLGGNVEVDETYIGGKGFNMSARRKARRGLKGKSSGFAGKVAVMGLLERQTAKASRVRVQVVPNNKKSVMQPIVRQHVEAGSNLYTDALLSYDGLASDYIHGVIDHAVSYVDGQIHTNGLENFWSLLKRAIKGTYVSVEPFHLFRYLDEQSFRFNQRETNDSGRFMAALKGIAGRRLTFANLTGAEAQTC